MQIYRSIGVEARMTRGRQHSCVQIYASTLSNLGFSLIDLRNVDHRAFLTRLKNKPTLHLSIVLFG